MTTSTNTTPNQRTPRQQHAFTEDLGIHGWGHLDPILLAALAIEAPVLLVGTHGTAKSLVVERTAHALGATLRHYNASLLNYDDLVGIPLPDEHGTSLRFVATAGAIWDAEFVFFDEINRCRPDLANKLFPIVHERRVTGVDLRRLRHRWAAMNPPAAGSDDLYVGTEELDAALVDRFSFIVPVPEWSEFSVDDRLRVVRGSDPDTHARRRIPMLVERTAHIAGALNGAVLDRIQRYVVVVIDQLANADLVLSARRATMLGRAIAAVHAARHVLGHIEATLDDSAELTLGHALPQRATADSVFPLTVAAAHDQAWSLSADPTSPLTQVLTEPDPIRRVARARELGLTVDQLSDVVTDALGRIAHDRRRAGAAAAMFHALRTEDLRPRAWEALLHAGRPLLVAGEDEHRAGDEDSIQALRRVVREAELFRSQDLLGRLEANFLCVFADALVDDVQRQHELSLLRQDVITLTPEVS